MIGGLLCCLCSVSKISSACVLPGVATSPFLGAFFLNMSSHATTKL